MSSSKPTPQASRISLSAGGTAVPRYLEHSSRNRAYVYLPHPDGGRWQV